MDREDQHIFGKALTFIKDINSLYRTAKELYPNAHIAFRQLLQSHDSYQTYNRVKLFNDHLLTWCLQMNCTYLYSYLDSDPKFWFPDNCHPSILGSSIMAQTIWKQIDILTNKNYKPENWTKFIHYQLQTYIKDVIDSHVQTHLYFETKNALEGAQSKKIKPKSKQTVDKPRNEGVDPYTGRWEVPFKRKIYGISGKRITWHIPKYRDEQVIIMLGDDTLQYLVSPCKFYRPVKTNHFLLTGIIKKERLCVAYLN